MLEGFLLFVEMHNFYVIYSIRKKSYSIVNNCGIKIVSKEF
jgi:hypothetical protein